MSQTKSANKAMWAQPHECEAEPVDSTSPRQTTFRAAQSVGPRGVGVGGVRSSRQGRCEGLPFLRTQQTSGKLTTTKEAPISCSEACGWSSASSTSTIDRSAVAKRIRQTRHHVLDHSLRTADVSHSPFTSPPSCIESDECSGRKSLCHYHKNSGIPSPRARQIPSSSSAFSPRLFISREHTRGTVCCSNAPNHGMTLQLVLATPAWPGHKSRRDDLVILHHPSLVQAAVQAGDRSRGLFPPLSLATPMATTQT